jgi:hypothetical protein
MANAGAHLVDRVVPDVPLRQFVLSLPHELRMLAAFKSDVLTALSRIFADAVLASYSQRAERHGVEGGVGGSVTLVQRFGGSLNLNVHMHGCFLDGVFTRDESGRVVFHALPKPEPSDLSAVLRRVHDRAVSWLRKRGYLDSPEAEGRPDASDNDALEACAQIAMRRGSFVKLADAAPPAETETEPRSALVAELEGFNLHAGVHIAAGDDMGREKLLRYGARPAFALDRLRRLPDGRITYKVKYSRPRSKYRVMTPLELLARLASLIPPPRYPLSRFHGVLAPRSKWRKEVVPRPPDPASSCPDTKASGRSTLPRPQTPPGLRSPPRGRQARENDGPSRATITEAAGSLDIVSAGSPKCPGAYAGPTVDHHDLPEDASVTPPAHDAPRPLLAPGVLATHVAPNVLSVSHWNRLARGELYAATRRVPWRELLRRTFDVDVEICAACGGRLRVIGAVVDPRAARRTLERLGLHARAPPIARARDATELQGFEAVTIGDA